MEIGLYTCSLATEHTSEAELAEVIGATGRRARTAPITVATSRSERMTAGYGIEVRPKCSLPCAISPTASTN